MTYSTLLKLKNDAILVEYLICATELIASSEKGYKEFRDDKGQVYRATNYDPRLGQRVQVPIRGGNRQSEKPSAEASLDKAGGLSKNTELKQETIQASFGEGCLSILDNVLGATGEVAAKARQIATAQYKKIEPNLEKITGHQVEQKIQDALIHLQVLQKRSLTEEIASVRSPEEAVKVVQNHQAEVVAATATIAGAAAMAFGPQFLIALMFAAGDLTAIDIGAIAVEVMATMFTSEASGFVTEEIAKNFTSDKKTLAEIHSVASILTAIAAGYTLNSYSKSFKVARTQREAANAQAKAQSEMMSNHPRANLDRKLKEAEGLAKRTKVAPQKERVSVSEQAIAKQEAVKKAIKDIEEELSNKEKEFAKKLGDDWAERAKGQGYLSKQQVAETKRFLEKHQLEKFAQSAKLDKKARPK